MVFYPLGGYRTDCRIEERKGGRTTATTRIIPLHLNKGKTLAACLSARIGYAINPDKTENYEQISAYECDPHTADAEFLFSKRQYEHITGRTQKNDVIAYQIRQSFRPGEVTPEEANRIGYEFAMRFLKGNHAFLVCTHTDTKHIHNHIFFNSTTLDCTHKFRDFLGSGRAIGRLSDIICMEHGLSIIEKPKRYTHPTYDKWHEENGIPKKPSNREQVRVAIDAILAQTPPDMQAFLRLLEEAGYMIRRGKHISLRHPDFKRAVRLDSLGDGYTEDAIMAVLAGTKEHKPRQRKKNPLAKPKNSLLIDIEAKLQEGKGGDYKQWATVHNLKQMAQTVGYLREHGLLDYDELVSKTAAATARFNELSDQIKGMEKRLAEVAVLKTHIINYGKTRDVYVGYRKAGYSKKYLAEHEGDILLHKAAKKAFDELGVKKLPTVKALQAEYSTLLAEKKSAYAEYRTVRAEMKELLIHKSNVEQILGKGAAHEEKKNVHNRG